MYASLFSQDYCSSDHTFCVSFPSLLPALRESPPGGEPSAAVNDEGDCHITPHHTAHNACMEPKDTTSLSFIGVGSNTHIHSHILILYMCTGDIYN